MQMTYCNTKMLAFLVRPGARCQCTPEPAAIKESAAMPFLLIFRSHLHFSGMPIRKGGHVVGLGDLYVRFVFDGEELLLDSIKSIKPNVDYIAIVYQTVCAHARALAGRIVRVRLHALTNVLLCIDVKLRQFGEPEARSAHEAPGKARPGRRAAAV